MRKLLFDIGGSTPPESKKTESTELPKKRGRPRKEPQPVITEPPKKRGRPKKEPVVVQEPPKKRGRPKKEAPIIPEPPKKRGRPKKVVEEPLVKPITKPIQETVTDEEVGWIDYYTQRPEDNVPVEFRVKTNKGFTRISQGFITQGYLIYTNDPYNIITMRKRFKNLWYRLIGCPNLDKCPERFPDCKHCKNKKEGSKK